MLPQEVYNVLAPAFIIGIAAIALLYFAEVRAYQRGRLRRMAYETAMKHKAHMEASK